MNKTSLLKDDVLNMNEFEELQNDIIKLVNLIPVQIETKEEFREVITNMITISCSKYGNDSKFRKEIDQYLNYMQMKNTYENK